MDAGNNLKERQEKIIEESSNADTKRNALNEIIAIQTKLVEWSTIEETRQAEKAMKKVSKKGDLEALEKLFFGE